jgi:membrane-bound metal-dependent hydrolase YbcI (DUF457 family)
MGKVERILMAGFKTHVATSTLVGGAYALAGHFGWDIPTTNCVLAAGLCSVSGMLPDLDSDSGVPARETMAFFAAVVPILMIDRFQQLGWSNQTIAVAGGLIYLAVRFGIGEIFRRYTVHRGMWHSLPAALSAGLLAFLICSCEDLTLRVFQAAAVVLGFTTHLVLDELWSFKFRRGLLQRKQSAGTALKLWSRRPWANVSTYGKLLALSAMAVSDPILMQHFGYQDHPFARTARHWAKEAVKQAEQQPTSRLIPLEEVFRELRKP